jgi:hypothetical protein
MIPFVTGSNRTDEGITETDQSVDSLSFFTDVQLNNSSSITNTQGNFGMGMFINEFHTPHPLAPSPEGEGGTPSPLGEGWGEVINVIFPKVRKT